MGRSSLKSVMRLINTQQKKMAPEQSFLADLKRSMELTENKKARKPSPTYKPSSMNCIRNMYYQIVGADQDPESASYVLIGICNAGSDVHVRVQTAISQMKDNGIDCEYVDVADFINQRGIKDVEVVSKVGAETKLRNTVWNMSFMCDGIIRYQNHYYILELKSETANKWFSRQGVDPGHYNQATAYSMSLGLSEVIFVYINRDIFDMKSFLFAVTPEMVGHLQWLMLECDSYVEDNKVPPKPEDVSKKTCEYCSYKTRCRKDI